jgi:D-alanyl-D-alanine carboxypeptidase
VRRFVAAALAVFVLFLHQTPTAHGAEREISAACAVVMDASSGRVLWEKNSHEPGRIASTTKLLTALVALESGHGMEEVVTIDGQWAGAEGSSIYLRAGEQVTLETLLYGLLLCSGNDAAIAVAGYFGGSVEQFVAQMNDKAEALGMSDSHFSNPNGLDQEGHYASAYDMALLARACLQNEALAKIAATRSITMGGRTFVNHNKLLWRYPGCVGLKTGYTEKAGRTLVSAAERDGLTLICVTLNDPNDWADHAALLDAGFAQYESRTLVQQGEVLTRLPVTGSLRSFCTVTAAETVSAALQAGDEPERTLQLNRETLEAPVTAGTKVGEVVFTLNGQELGRTAAVVDMDVAEDTAPELGLLGRLFAWWKG